MQMVATNALGYAILVLVLAACSSTTATPQNDASAPYDAGVSFGRRRRDRRTRHLRAAARRERRRRKRREHVRRHEHGAERRVHPVPPGARCTETTACLGYSKCAALDACTNDCSATNGGDAGNIAACAQACNTQADANVRLEWRAYNDCLTFRCVANGSGPCQ